MKREIATLPADLPHDFVYDGQLMASDPPKFRCQCGREKADELHNTVHVETASDRVTLVTEKGVI